MSDPTPQVAIATASELNGRFKGKRRYATHSMPDSGATVRYQSLTMLEKGRHQAAMWAKDLQGADPTRVADADARLLAATLVDEQGNRLYSDRSAGEICQWDATPDVIGLVKQIRIHCGFATEEETKKPADFSASDSAETAPAAPPSASPPMAA